MASPQHPNSKGNHSFQGGSLKDPELDNNMLHTCFTFKKLWQFPEKHKTHTCQRMCNKLLALVARRAAACRATNDSQLICMNPDSFAASKHTAARELDNNMLHTGLYIL